MSQLDEVGTLAVTYRFCSWRLFALDQASILIKSSIGLLEHRVHHVNNLTPIHVNILDILEPGGFETACVGSRAKEPCGEAQQLAGSLVEEFGDLWVDGALESEILAGDAVGGLDGRHEGLLQPLLDGFEVFGRGHGAMREWCDGVLWTGELRKRRPGSSTKCFAMGRKIARSFKPGLIDKKRHVCLASLLQKTK